MGTNSPFCLFYSRNHTLHLHKALVHAERRKNSVTVLSPVKALKHSEVMNRPIVESYWQNPNAVKGCKQEGAFPHSEQTHP